MSAVYVCQKYDHRFKEDKVMSIIKECYFEVYFIPVSSNVMQQHSQEKFRDGQGIQFVENAEGREWRASIEHVYSPRSRK